jgi:hypothetical protein
VSYLGLKAKYLTLDLSVDNREIYRTKSPKSLWLWLRFTMRTTLSRASLHYNPFKDSVNSFDVDMYMLITFYYFVENMKKNGIPNHNGHQITSEDLIVLKKDIIEEVIELTSRILPEPSNQRCGDEYEKSWCIQCRCVFSIVRL